MKNSAWSLSLKRKLPEIFCRLTSGTNGTYGDELNRHVPRLASNAAPFCAQLFGASGFPRPLPWELSAFGMTPFALGVNTGSDRKSTRLNSSHLGISYAVFCF